MIKHMIISCHPDDELIGCFEILMKEQPTAVIYTEKVDNNRREEALELKNQFNNSIIQVFNRDIPYHLIDQQETILYFPDPVYETHPAHRAVGAEGEYMLRKKGLNVLFYTTNMLAPYIHEVKNVIKKEGLLNIVYTSQKSLWEYEKKYVLFEGRCKWIM